MLFKKEKAGRYRRFLYFKHFNTEEIILQQPRDKNFISILPRHQNIADRFLLLNNEIGQISGR